MRQGSGEAPKTEQALGIGIFVRADAVRQALVDTVVEEVPGARVVCGADPEPIDQPWILIVDVESAERVDQAVDLILIADGEWDDRRFTDVLAPHELWRFRLALRRQLGFEKRLGEVHGQLQDAQFRGLVYHQMFETNQAVKLLIDPSDGRILDANQAASDLYGYDHGELTRMTVYDINTMEPEEIKGNMLRAREKERLVFQFKHRTKSGDIREVEVFSGPVHLTKKRLLFSIVVDVTEREHALEALRLSEENFRILFEHSPDGVFLSDLEGRCLDANAAGLRMLGYSLEELRQLNVVDVIDPKSLAEVPFDTERLLAGESTRAERRLICKDGGGIDVEVAAKRLPNKQLLGLVRDISQRKEAQRQREHFETRILQMQKLESVGRLAGGIAHDFNNLLLPIIGFAELGMIQATDDKLRDTFEKVIDAAERGKSLTSRLLVFSRNQALERKLLDINALISRFKTLLDRVISEDVDIVLNLTDGLPPIHADPVQIEQVLLNLVINGRDAMPDGGTIEIKTRRLSRVLSACGRNPVDAVALSVRDTGSGMDNDIRQHVFEPFFSTKDVSKGTGLGLSVIHGIVTQHDGEIDLTSRVGVGTTFEIYLPAAGAQVIDTATHKRRATNMDGEERIALIEDDPIVRRLLCEGLEFFGYRVAVFNSAQDIIDWLAGREDQTQFPFELVVSDIVMPSIRGTELVNQLRARFGAIKAILISGYAQSDWSKELNSSEDSAFLRKPFAITDLLTEVRAILES